METANRPEDCHLPRVFDQGRCVLPIAQSGAATDIEGVDLQTTAVASAATETADDDITTTIYTDGDGIARTIILPHSTTLQNLGNATTRVATSPTPGNNVAVMTSASTPEPTTQAATASSQDNGSGLSSGAVAGIAIGALLIGALLAFLAAMFFFKRRHRSRETNMGTAKGYTSYADSTPELVMMQQAKAVNLGGRSSPYVQVSQNAVAPALPAAVPVVHHARNVSDAADAAGAVAAFVPPAAHDHAIHDRVSALFNGIHRHIETYYRDVHASITPSMEAGIARFGAEGVSMAELLQDISTPTTALKHALVAYVLGITGPARKDDSASLFPEELSGMRDGGVGADANLAAAHTLQRRLAVYIYTSTPPPSSSSSPSPSTRRASRTVHADIREAAEHFSLTFFPWANPVSSDQVKDEDLARLISEALDLSIWLFGQPYAYGFEWEGMGRRGVLVSPGLVRGSEDGKRDWVVEGVVVGI
ncbi:hypothetical protein ACN47E_007781 [Coniothyrium glycines]